MNHPLLQLQQSHGNQAVQRLVKHGPHPKLQVGRSDDKYEREADNVAERVLRMPEPDREDDTNDVGPKDVIISLNSKSDTDSGHEIPQHIESQINSLKGSGSPLADSMRSYFEPRFGRDFDGVRIHKGERAAKLNAALNARAFTYDQDIYFGRGSYKPETQSGRKLLAHELTHVIQQKSIERTRSVAHQNEQPSPLQRQETVESGVPSSQPAEQKSELISRWKWTNIQGDNQFEDHTAEIKDFTQRFLGLIMPRPAMLTYHADAKKYLEDNKAEVTTYVGADFRHFESFARFIARGWNYRHAAMADERAWELDPVSGTITMGVPSHVVDTRFPTKDGPLSVRARVTSSTIQPVNENKKQLAVTVETHVNVGGSITESASAGGSLGGEFGAGGGKVSPGAEVGGSWSITHDAGEVFHPLKPDVVPFIFTAERESKDQ